MQSSASDRRAERTAILVLGMHRSGTSALTGTLACLGVALSRQLIGAGTSNPKGYWEAVEIKGVMESLLAAAGSSWNDWRPLDLSKAPAGAVAQARAVLLAHLEREFADCSIF